MTLFWIGFGVGAVTMALVGIVGTWLLFRWASGWFNSEEEEA